MPQMQELFPMLIPEPRIRRSGAVSAHRFDLAFMIGYLK